MSNPEISSRYRSLSVLIIMCIMCRAAFRYLLFSRSAQVLQNLCPHHVTDPESRRIGRYRLAAVCEIKQWAVADRPTFIHQQINMCARLSLATEVDLV